MNNNKTEQITFYNSMKCLTKEDLEKEIRDTGAVFLGAQRMHDARYEVFAQLPYVAGRSEEEYLAIFKANPEGKLLADRCKLYIMPPISRKAINPEGDTMAFSKFFKSVDNYIAKMIKRYNKLFGIGMKDVDIYANLDWEKETAVFYGVAIEAVKPSDFNMNSIDYKSLVNKYSCDDFVKMKKRYIEKIKADFELTDETDDDSDGSNTLQKTGKERLVKKIMEWTSRVTFREFSDEITNRVKGQDAVKIVIVNVYNYMKNIAAGKQLNNNMLIAAPSGCGKTETFRAIRDYFKAEIPGFVVAQVDMTSITEEGFKGKDTKDMLAPLFKCSEADGIGILFCDEFDKKLLPSYSSSGTDVNAAVQAQILTAVEGAKMTSGDKTIDTCNTMFIGLGAFDMCRKKKTVVEKHMGFGAENEGGADHYEHITRQDMIDIGASYELLGRFPFIVNYTKLDDDTIYEIIESAIKEQEESLDCTIELSEAAKKELLATANSQYGCRIIKSKLQEALMPSYIELMYDEEKERVIVLDEIE